MVTAKCAGVLAVVLVSLFCCFGESEGWSGHYVTVRRVSYYRYLRCVCHSWWWGCCGRRWEWRSRYYYQTQCQAGWTHNGDKDCDIPVCRPDCSGGGGTCASPNYCDCPSTSTGPTTGCGTATCSYALPCFPGNCYATNKCDCEPGFKSVTRSEGCLSFDENVEEMRPTIGRSTATLSMVRRSQVQSDEEIQYMFSIDGTNATEDETIYWLNQKRINVVEFELESIYTPDTLPQRPSYVHDAKIGIVHNQVAVNVSKLPRDHGIIRDPGSYTIHECNNGASDQIPHVDESKCEIRDDQFMTLIDHGDWMTITYQSRNGGYRNLVNIDQGSTPYANNVFNGLTATKKVEFRFDFVAPEHCTAADPNSCPQAPDMLSVQQEFTKNAIRPRWSGWTDDLSGVWQYYVEVFLLSPDPYNRLIEMTPLDPVYSTTINENGTIVYPQYTPAAPGMYSVLMETRDKANNSRTARKLVLYDNSSSISLSTDHRLYVSSAVAETGHTWQTATEGGDTRIAVNWENRFVNHLHEDNMLLNQVQPYPLQFKDIADDGILSVKKYVSEALDDHEGERTVDAIDHFHGIVRFQTARVYTEDKAEPTTGWTDIAPLAESITFIEQLSDGAKVRVWVSAYDVMGNRMVDSTSVHFDTSPPKVSGNDSASTRLLKNVDTEEYISSLKFDASDDQSGVHWIDFTITAHVDGKGPQVLYTNSTPAHVDLEADPATSPSCRDVLGSCFMVDQTVNLSNCWFLVGKDDLENASATINVTVYNQAMLSQSLQFRVDKITELKGLETYNGPDNIRIDETSDSGFIIRWDLPDQPSCYGRSEIIILVYKKDESGATEMETFYVRSTDTQLKVSFLDPDTSYEVQLGMKLQGNQMASGTTLAVKTAEEDSGTNAGVIAGVAVGVVALVALMLVAFILLMRRGHLQPMRRGLRAVSTRYRKTFYGGRGGANEYVADGPSTTMANRAYDNSGPKRPVTAYDEELYLYGGMDFDTGASWNLSRSDITFQTLIKSGHFANVYQSKLRGSRDVVACKTLKDGFSADDKLLMTAKINFTGNAVGHHPNILKFVGAVTEDAGMGPFIIYEYCEVGPMGEYLRSQKSNVTLELQENMFRFGRSIAIGMEYLASKRIVHRRLAARNILVTSQLDVKIAGFGPQPAEDTTDGDAGKEKRERIPVKWSAPECMSSSVDATEKSDVWSFAVVLWEIFTMGDSPYSKIRSRDLPAKVKNGERLAKPDTCDDTWFGVMSKCWALQQDKRPTFAEIRGELDEVFVAAPGDDYYYYQR